MKSIEEKISENVLTTLQGISALEGYSNTIVFEREDRLGNTVKQNTAILSEEPAAFASEQSVGRDRYAKRYTVKVPVMLPDTTTEADGARKANLRSDIIKRLTTTYTRNSLAIDTRYIDSSQMFGDSGNFTGEQINFDVMFWTAKDDPFSQ